MSKCYDNIFWNLLINAYELNCKMRTEQWIHTNVVYFKQGSIVTITAIEKLISWCLKTCDCSLSKLPDLKIFDFLYGIKLSFDCPIPPLPLSRRGTRKTRDLCFGSFPKTPRDRLMGPFLRCGYFAFVGSFRTFRISFQGLVKLMSLSAFPLDCVESSESPGSGTLSTLRYSAKPHSHTRYSGMLGLQPKTSSISSK